LQTLFSGSKVVFLNKFKVLGFAAAKGRWRNPEAKLSVAGVPVCFYFLKQPVVFSVYFEYIELATGQAGRFIPY
jgi:hypothetical protein